MKRATPNPCENCVTVLYFNPRPREEGDLCQANGKHEGIISIHALVKRATVTVVVYVLKSLYFNPRPREEGDLWIADSR